MPKSKTQDSECKKKCKCPKKRCLCLSLYPPTVRDLHEKLTPGVCITIEGFLPLDCSRFVVNLSCDRKPKSDIALHIKPQLSLKHVVRNCRIGGRWQEEELTTMQKFDLERNKRFVMDILLAEREFMIAINGRHFCAFIYRIPVSYVKVITVEGRLSLDDIQCRLIEIYPRPSTQPAPLTLPLGSNKYVEKKQTAAITSSPMRTPITAVLPQGLPVGSELEIAGYIKILSKTFFINLQDGIHFWPYPDVHLHIKSVSSTAFENQTFFYNTRSNGVWGRQERFNAHRFTPATDFKLAIQRLQDHFSIWVDGQLLGEMKFRGKVDKINSAYIQGEIYINSLCVKQINKMFR